MKNKQPTAQELLTAARHVNQMTEYSRLRTLVDDLLTRVHGEIIGNQTHPADVGETAFSRYQALISE